MVDNSKLASYMKFRCCSKSRNEFTRKASSMGIKPSTLLRQFMDAFNEGRLTITLTDTQKKRQGELYD